MKKGLTIVEMAIALAVIGILIAFALNGRTLIEAVQIKAEIYKLRKIRAAYATYMSKYGKLPGEVVNPEMFGATFDTTAYATKEAMNELINEGLLKEGDFKIDLLDGAYWNISGCSGYAFESGVWLDLPPNLSRNICVFPSSINPKDHDKDSGHSLAKMYNSLKFICLIETNIDDKSLRSGLGRLPENLTDTYEINDYSDCFSMSNTPEADKYYLFKVF